MPRCFSASQSSLDPPKSPPQFETEGNTITLDFFMKSGRSLIKHTHALDIYTKEISPLAIGVFLIHSSFSAASASQKKKTHKNTTIKKKEICPNDKLPLDLTFFCLCSKTFVVITSSQHTGCLKQFKKLLEGNRECINPLNRRVPPTSHSTKTDEESNGLIQKTSAEQNQN